jgi:LysM domain
VKKSIVIAGALVFGGAALAQTTSDLMPPPPQPAAGAGSVYYPGMPVPAPPANPAEETGPRRGVNGKELPPSGLVLYDDMPGADEEPDLQVDSPTGGGTHVVKRGDTLWGVSATYFHNPWYWPKLWALNPAITNPHWIYPGDILKLSAASAEPEPRPEAKPEQRPDEIRKFTGRTRGPTGLYLRQNGFVEPGELAVAGTLIGSKEEKIMLATLDEAYVQYSDKQPLVVGEKYSVYKPIREVKHPVTGKRLGDIVEIFGEVQVKALTEGKIARVQILASTDSIERGVRVGPLRRTFKMVDPKPAAKDMSAVVVATLRPVVLVGTEMLVFIDRGEKDGVELGNQFLIVRRGDGYQPILWRNGPIDDKRFPREVVGVVQVVDLRDQLATGWVIQASKEARVGDRVELRTGQ